MRRITLLHSGWQLAAKSWLAAPRKLGFSTLEWLPATVPGHVHLDLVRHGVIAHPFERLFELGCQWVDEVDWCYRTQFEFRPDADRPRRVLVFEGLDTVCVVRLNGEVVAEHDDMFVPLEIDVSARLRAGTNELELEFRSAAREGRARRERYFTREGLDPGLLHFDERAFVRKAQYMFGWDWGPRLVSAGIWGKVALHEFRARLTDVHVRQRHLADGSVELSFHSEIDGEGIVVHHVQGFDRTLRDGEVLRIETPRLWWPAGSGEAHLYAVTSCLLPEAPASGVAFDALERRALDRRAQRIGLRTLRLVRDDDRFGQSFEIEVNGRRLYAVGANWIPDSSFPSELTRERVHARLAQARDMNMNMLRIWGGGLYESDDFYDGTDALGILVWQDFPYACSYYPDDEAAQAVARNEARAAIRRLRNRPSLALWCGNNENLTMYENKWGEPERHPARYYGERIYEVVLPEVLAELDPERPYIPTSPWGGVHANADGVGDQHYWDVWHGRGDWKHYGDSGARFASEFGFASAPGRAAWRRIAPHADDPARLDVRDAAARWHDKTAKGYETFIGYVELHYPRARDLEEWTYTSQLNQRDALRFAIEHYRRSEFCKGALIWQLNDCWPVQSWAVLDSESEYKAAAFELRRLYAPALVSLVVEGREAALWCVLDNAEHGVEGVAELEARSLRDGASLEAWQAPVALAPGERRRVLRADLSRFDPTTTLLVARWLGTSTVRLLCEPKDARFVEPTLTATRVADGVLLASDVPVVDLFLWDVARGARLDPSYVTLPAPGQVLVRASGPIEQLAARSLLGRHAVRVQ